MLDNASAHVGKAFGTAAASRRRSGELFYLPPYSAELNDFELVRR
nr:transposase [Streptomyces sp. NBC_00886]